MITILSVLKSLYKSIFKAVDNELIETSGFVSYTILLSFFPFLILLISVAAQIGQTQDVQNIILYVAEKIPKEISEDIIPIIDSIVHNDAGSLITFSIIGMIWVASSGIESMRLALNKAYEANESRHFLLLRAQSILILIFGVIIIAALSLGFYVIPTVLGAIPPEVEAFLPTDVIAKMDKLLPFFEFSSLTTHLVSLLVTAGLIYILYRGLPNHKHNIKKPLLPGCALAALMCFLFSDLFSYFLRNFGQYHTIYKSLGGVVIFMLFIQFSTFCILLGAQFNTELGKLKK